MNTPFKMKGKSPMMKALIGKQGNLPVELKNKILASPAKLSAGSTLEKTKDKKGSQKVVNPDTREVTNVRVQRLKEAGAPASVIAKEKAKFIASEKAKKKSPAKKYKSDAQRKAVHASKSESPAKMYGKKSPVKKNPPIGSRKITDTQRKKLKSAMEKGKAPSKPATGPKRTKKDMIKKSTMSPLKPFNKMTPAEKKKISKTLGVTNKKSPAKNYKKGYYGV